MGNEPYDYRKYDQIWKRVAPQENPYPAARAAARCPSGHRKPQRRRQNEIRKTGHHSPNHFGAEH